MMVQDKFNLWLEDIIKTENPSKDIIAYNFGVFETPEGYEIYLVGSIEFDKDDFDWACNTDFVPKKKYFKLGQKNADWQIILEQVKKLIINFSETDVFKNSFLNNAKAIAAGFDDG